MNKILMIFLMIVPITAFAESDLGMQSQMLDSQIEKLTSERDSKYEALQKCEKSTKGFKIAGLTTLVATGFGIYGNIKLSEKIKGKNGKKSSTRGSLNLKVLSINFSCVVRIKSQRGDIFSTVNILAGRQSFFNMFSVD